MSRKHEIRGDADVLVTALAAIEEQEATTTCVYMPHGERGWVVWVFLPDGRNLHGDVHDTLADAYVSAVAALFEAVHHG